MTNTQAGGTKVSKKAIYDSDGGSDSEVSAQESAKTPKVSLAKLSREEFVSKLHMAQEKMNLNEKWIRNIEISLAKATSQQ